MPASPSDCTGVIEVDLDALARNYCLFQEKSAPAECAAAVKADAYGLGAAAVSERLWREGCRSFFVATLDEAIELRAVLSEAVIYVLDGLMPGQHSVLEASGLIPVLNDLGQVDLWQRYCRAQETALPAVIQIDTGMNRLGLSVDEAIGLTDDRRSLSGIGLHGIMSHLACASDRAHPLNEQQRMDFAATKGLFPGVRASLANSAGVLLGANYHFDMVRVGIGLYGGMPLIAGNPEIEPVVRVRARILQERTVNPPATIGYNATFSVKEQARLITVAAGYADGFSTSMSNFGSVAIDGQLAPVVGRVSMDLITVDVSKIEPEATRPGGFVDLIGPGQTLDEFARRAGLISYEILTSLGRRFERRYSQATSGDSEAVD